MTRFWQIYYNALFGAMGGLLAWLAVGQVDSATWEINLAYSFIGAGVGLGIGTLIGAVEGLLLKRSLWQAVVGACWGGLIGLLSGVVGLLAGEWVFVTLGGELPGRAAAWTILGFCLGLGQGLVSRKRKRAVYGAMGGITAGLLGGIAYEALTQIFLEQVSLVQMVLGAVALMVIGASLGAIIPLSIDLIAKVAANRGLLRVLNGSRAGLEYLVIDATTLGSYDGCDLYLPGDKGIEKRQAKIDKGPQGFRLKNIGQDAAVTVNGLPLRPDHTLPLPAGATIQLGNTILQFI